MELIDTSELTLDEYQLLAAETANYVEAGDRTLTAVNYTIHGLTGEAGEVSNKFKKVLRDNSGQLDDITRQRLADEVGDVLWYCARLSEELGFSLSEVAQGNVDKLASRKARGVLGGSGDER